MTSFLATSYGLAAFFLVLGGVLFWIAIRSNHEGKFPVRGLLMANVFMYLALAHLAMWGGVGYSVEETVFAPCEYVINTTNTTQVGAVVGTYGDMYHYNDAGTAITVSSANAWYPVEITQAGNLNNVSFDSTHDWLGVTQTGVYSIDWAFSFSGGLSDEYVIAPFVNNVTQITPCTQHRLLGTGGDVGSSAGVCLYSLSTGDNVSLKIKNLDAAADASARNVDLMIERMVDTASSPDLITTYTYRDSCEDLAPAPITSIMLWGLYFSLALSIVQVMLWILWKSLTWFIDKW